MNLLKQNVAAAVLVTLEDNKRLGEPMVSSQLPQHIFRAYDIRGDADTELTNSHVYQIGYAFGQWLQRHQVSSVNLGWDGRLSSPRMVAVLSAALLASGCRVISVGQCHTGLLYFSTYQQDSIASASDSAVMVTASHNPKSDNGFKMVFGCQPLTEEQIQEIYRGALLVATPQGYDGDFQPSACISQQLQQCYQQRLLNDLAPARPLKVVIDAGNGSAGPMAQAILQAMNVELISLYCEIDGQFPNHHPDPSQAHNLIDLCQGVRQHKADLGLAFDGDGDRVVAVDHKGQAVSSDHLLMLLIKEIVPRHPGATVIADVKSCRHIGLLTRQLHGRCVTGQTGHSKMKQKMADSQAIVGGEFSGHFYIADNWYGFDDGIYVGLRLLQQLSKQADSLADLVAPLPCDIATPEIQLSTDEASKRHIMTALAADDELLASARVNTIDGIRLEYAAGWGLIRASNTSPKLTLRVAAGQLSDAQNIWQKLYLAIAKIAPDLALQMEKSHPFDGH